MWSNQNRGYMKKGNSERGEVTCSNVSRLSVGKPRFYPQFVNRPTLLSADTAMLSVCKQAPAKRVRSTAFQSLLLSHPLSPLPSSPPLPARREGSSRAVLQNSAPASFLFRSRNVLFKTAFCSRFMILVLLVFIMRFFPFFSLLVDFCPESRCVLVQASLRRPGVPGRL